MSRDQHFKARREPEPMRTEPNHHGDGYYGYHPSFGQLEINRVSGRFENMVGVDFPQGGAIKISLRTARMERNHGDTRFYADKIIAECYLSNVQFAALITNINSEGVPVTLRHYCTAEMIDPGEPPVHMIDVDGLIEEAKEPYDAASEALAELVALTKEKSPSKVRVRELAQKVQREFELNSKFRVEQAERTIKKAADRGKQEVTAFAEMTVRAYGLARLGADLSLLPGTAEPAPLQIEGGE